MTGDEQFFESSAADEQVVKLRRDLAQLRSQNRAKSREVRHLISALEEAEQLRDVALGVTLDDFRPRPEITVSAGGGGATVIALLSDVHVGARVNPAEVGGLNEFDPSICKRRLERWAEAVVWLVDKWRGLYRIDDLMLPIIGDLIENVIHEELRSHNTLTPVKEVQYVIDTLEPILRWIVDESKVERCLLYMCDGNHGRMTRKLYASGRADWSLTHLAYFAIRKAFAGDPRVRCVVSTGHRDYVRLYRWTFRFEHGDSIRYNGGVGGIAIPFNKYIYRVNSTRYADHTMVGHFHTLQMVGRNVINGSIKGFDSYAEKLGLEYEPPQQWAGLVSERYGLEMHKRIVVDADMSRVREAG